MDRDSDFALAAGRTELTIWSLAKMRTAWHWSVSGVLEFVLSNNFGRQCNLRQGPETVLAVC